MKASYQSKSDDSELLNVCIFFQKDKSLTREQLLISSSNVFSLHGLDVPSKAAHRVINTETESQHIYGP